MHNPIDFKPLFSILALRALAAYCYVTGGVVESALDYPKSKQFPDQAVGEDDIVFSPEAITGFPENVDLTVTVWNR